MLHIIVLSLLLSTGHVFSCYPAIFSFGNSLTDTGNYVSFDGNDNVVQNKLPYGQTYFNHPTGRFSDGRLVIDFIAQGLGLPLLSPYPGRKESGDFTHGADFAVAGANALSNDFFESIKVDVTWNDSSLSTQLGWFKQFLKSYPDYNQILGNSLFYIGELGINDYGKVILGEDPTSVKSILLPHIMKKIGSTVHELVNLGARTILIAGIIPLGCTPAYLTTFQSPNVIDYDSETGCLKWWNSFTHLHNKELQNTIDELKKLHPEVTFIYGDYYSPIMKIIRDPTNFGMKEPLLACCGGDGPYNYNGVIACGSPTSKVCDNSSNSVSWDGLHLTEATHGIVAHEILFALQENLLLFPNCKKEVIVSLKASNL